MVLQTIEKALAVFKLFAQEQSSLGTTELADRLGTKKASMSRVLTTLKKHDFVEQNPDTRRYRFGPEMAKIARAVYRSLDNKVVSIATPFANKLRDKAGETVHLEVLSGNNFYLAYVAMTPNPISLNIEVGDQVMPHAHAGAKAVVAFSQPGEVDYWLKKDLPSYTDSTITDPDQLRTLYKVIRESGISNDYGEYIEEIHAIGAPIFNHENKPEAGIIIVVPSYRMQKKWPQKYIGDLKRAANAVSAQLHSSRKI